MKFYSFIVFFLIINSGFAQNSLEELLDKHNKNSIPYITVEELRMLQLNSDIAILDSREVKEYKVSHLKGALHVGYNDFSALTISEEISDKNTPIIVYCSLGIRSEVVANKLKKAGFTNVKNLYGGIFEWKNKDYPIINTKNNKTDSVHTFSKTWSKWLTKGIKVFDNEAEK